MVLIYEVARAPQSGVVKMKINNKLALFVLAFAGLAVADYAQTTITFAVPSTTTFTNTYLDGGSNSSEGAFPPTTVGASYFFNSTTGWSELIQPCINGIAYSSSSVRCQAGVARPAIKTANTGTVTQKFYYKFDAAIPTGVLTCINGSKAESAGSQVVKSGCLLGDLNDTAWAIVATGVLPPPSTSSAINVTIYANFTAVAGQTTARTLYTNSTT